jgi:hypothetical protein
MRAAIAIGMLVLGASAGTLTTLPRPTFPGPAAAPSGPHRLVLLSSTRVGVSNLGISSISVSGPSFHGLPPQSIFSTANRKFVLYGRDGSTGRYLVAYAGATPLYAYDFVRYARPPAVRAGNAGLVYEQPMWAQERNGVLYVENAHLTYAAASYNRNAYITAIDLKMRRAIWRSPALVANAFNFLVTSRYVIAGYGFTNEPDYLYVLDRQTGRVLDRLLLPNGPERITLRGNVVHVRTYDHVVLAHLRGA